MLVIRLRRTGRTKKPSFRVVVAEKDMPIYGRFVDIIGNVNLQSDPKVIEIDAEKAKDWMKKGAQPTDTVARLMVQKGILKKEDLVWHEDLKHVKKKDAKKEGEKPAAAAPKEEKKEETPAEEGAKEETPAEEKAPEEAPKEEKVEEPKEEAKTEESKTEEATKEEEPSKES